MLTSEEIEAIEENDIVAVLYSSDGVNQVLVQGEVSASDPCCPKRVGPVSLDGKYDHVWLVSHDKGTPPWQLADVIYQADIGYLIRNRGVGDELEWIDQDGDLWSHSELSSPTIIH